MSLASRPRRTPERQPGPASSSSTPASGEARRSARRSAPVVAHLGAPERCELPHALEARRERARRRAPRPRPRSPSSRARCPSPSYSSAMFRPPTIARPSQRNSLRWLRKLRRSSRLGLKRRTWPPRSRAGCRNNHRAGHRTRRHRPVPAPHPAPGGLHEAGPEPVADRIGLVDVGFQLDAGAGAVDQGTACARRRPCRPRAVRVCGAAGGSARSGVRLSMATSFPGFGRP